MSKPVLYYPIGLPGCGKTTYLSKLDNLSIVCADLIREELFGHIDTQYSDEYLESMGYPVSSMSVRDKIFTCNEIVWNEVNRRLLDLGKEGRDAANDGTHLEEKYRRNVLEKFSPLFTVHALYFDVPLETSIERDRLRQNHNVGEKKIRDMNRKFDLPRIEEGFDVLETLDLDGNRLALLRRENE